MHLASKVYLTSPQIDKLRRVLNPTIPIYPSPSSSTFPTLHIVPKDFLRQVFNKLKEHSIDVTDIRLNGGAASYVLIKDSNFAYRDIDILFTLNTSLASERETTLYSSTNEPYLCDVWTIIKYIVCSCLIEHMPDVAACTPTFLASILDTYTKKNIQVTSEQNSWALLSLQNLLGRNLELKFIEHWKRQWQFSVDSFQIDLHALLFEHTSVTRQLPTGNVQIEAFNAVTIRKQNNDDDGGEEQQQQQASATPLEFGFFSSTNNFLPNNENPLQSYTLTTITTINTCDKPINKSRSRSLKPSTSTADDADDLSHSFLQFQLSVNEDIDDGIVMDTDDSTIDDDESNYRTPPMELSSSSSLLIPVYCAYKDLHEALYHLNHKLIATYEPEKLRGGGLLKYCDLLAQHYKAANGPEMVHMQRYMCSRFFIDFKTLPEQISVITKYVATHFLPCSIIPDLFERTYLNEIFQYLQYQQSSQRKSNEIDPLELINARLCLLFFEHLLAVIQQSCVCLAGDDKDLLFSQVRLLQECYHCEYEHLFINDADHYRQYHSFPTYPQHRVAPTGKHYGPPRGHGGAHRHTSSARQNHYAGYRHYPQATLIPTNARRTPW